MSQTEALIILFFAAILAICCYLLGFARGWLYLHESRSSGPSLPPEGDTRNDEMPPEGGTQNDKPEATNKFERRFKLNMPRAEIKIRLKAKGIKLSDIDRELGTHIGTTSECLRGAGRYQNVRALIAKKLELPISEMFPDQPTLPPLSTKKCRELAVIRQAFHQMGHTSRTIARESGLAYDRVSAMLNGSQYYPSMAAKIEAKFGVTIPDTRRRKRRS